VALFWSGNTLTGASEPGIDGLEAEQALIAPATSPEEQRAAMLAATAEAYAALEARWGPRESWGERFSNGDDAKCPTGERGWIGISGNLLGRMNGAPAFDLDAFKADVNGSLSLLIRGSEPSALVVDALRAARSQLAGTAHQLGAMIEESKARSSHAAWYAFDSEDAFVRLGVSKINNASNLVATWAANWSLLEETGRLPTQSDFTYVEYLMFEGAGDMEAHLTSPDGAVKELVEVMDMNVSVTDLSRYWSVVLGYIDYHKGVLARALASMRWLTNHDGSPEFESVLKTTVGRAVDAVRGMYAISGVPLPQVDGGRYIHGKGDGYALTFYTVTNEAHHPYSDYQNTSMRLARYDWVRGRPTFPGEHTERPAKFTDRVDDAIPLEHLLRTYRPAQHDGLTYPEFLSSLDMPRTFSNEECVNKVQQDGSCSKYWTYQTDRVDLDTGNGGWEWSEAAEQTRSYVMYLFGEINPGGRLASFDPARVEEVAFGIRGFDASETDGNVVLTMTERPDRVLLLVDAESGDQLGSASAAEPGPIEIPASGDTARTITVLSQPLPGEGTESATFAESSFVIDGRQPARVDFEIEAKE
jgi:hypothetical protein